jgi:hypothetical protein
LCNALTFACTDDLLSLDQGHVSRVGETRNDTKCRSENLEGRAHLGDLDTDRGIILHGTERMEYGGENWIRDRNQRAFVNMVLNLWML